jgi:beta-glucanase (GH16 family)
MIAKVAFFWVCLAATCSAQSKSPWKLYWGDEFDGPSGSRPDPIKWVFDLGNGGWGNEENQVYTDRPQNAALDGNGSLVIRAIREPNGGYTSARMKTLGRFEIKYGKIEARIKVPEGKGVWPAFWMLGADVESRGVGWPNCGEIDIMEHIGGEPSKIHGTVHGPGYSGSNSLGKVYTTPDGRSISDDFHVFSVEWAADAIDFLVDGFRYGRVTRSDLPKGTRWVFDHPFFLLFNLAIGGRWPGYPDSTTVFPQKMIVDYVRVYRIPEYAVAEWLVAEGFELVRSQNRIGWRFKSFNR